jgi:hypothetical protein
MTDTQADVEYHLDNDRLREFVATVDETAQEHDEVPALLDALRDPFEQLLAADDWLPDRYRNLPSDDCDNRSDMGGRGSGPA